MSMPQTGESPNMATATPLGPPRAQAAQKQHVGLLKLDAQPSAASNRPPPRARRGRSLPRCGELTFRAPPRHRAPEPGDLEGSWSPATEQPGIRGLRIGLPARQWRLRDACGLSRLNDFLALW